MTHLRWQTKKKKALLIQSVDKDVKQLELSYVVSGDTKWNSYMKNILAVSDRVTHSLTTWPVTHSCLPKWNETYGSSLIVALFIIAKTRK